MAEATRQTRSEVQLEPGHLRQRGYEQSGDMDARIELTEGVLELVGGPADVDRILAGHGLTRRVALTVPNFMLAIALVVGVPLAWVLARVAFPGRALVRGLVVLPLVLPPVVGGAALLFALGRRGLIGGPVYDATGLLLPFSIWGVILASTFVAMPFLVITVEAALRNLDARYEAAAATLGAGRWTIMRRVTLPMIAPSLAAGLVLTWARALGEFGATITFAGNFPGRTQTMPLAVYLALETNPQEAIVLALVLTAISFAVLVALRERWLGGGATTRPPAPVAA
jgi:molybdate transport system permease protein